MKQVLGWIIVWLILLMRAQWDLNPRFAA